MASPLDWISGIGNAISGFVAPIVSWYTNKKTNETNKENVDNTNQTNLDIATNTNETNKAIADENLQYQKDLFEYNKALQEEVFNREDTAYQRTKLDMLAAGLNPLSMQGTNGAGEIIPQTAPQNNFQAQQSAPMQAPINQESNLANTMLSAANQLFTSIQYHTNQRLLYVYFHELYHYNLINQINNLFFLLLHKYHKHHHQNIIYRLFQVLYLFQYYLMFFQYHSI